MTHKSYSSIENHYNEKFIKNIIKHFDKEQFIALEKIHGSNFSFQINYDTEDNTNIYCSSRSQRIGTIDNTDFFGTHQLILSMKQDIYNIKDKVKILIPTVQNMQIFCELFGGIYDHIDVKKSNYRKIQKGVNYTPDNNFLVFDIRVQTNSNDYYDFYLSHQEVTDILKDTKLKNINILYEGSLQDMLKLNPTFKSTIYSYYNLPEIENNFAEGYIIRKNSRIILSDSNHKLGELIVPIIKLKSPTFSEVTQIKVQIDTTIIEQVRDIQDNYINENRINAYKSKYPDEENNKSKIICGVVEDAVDEYIKIKEIEIEDREKFLKQVRKITSGKIISLLS